MVAITRWVGRKADVVVDEAIKTSVTPAGVMFVSAGNEPIHTAIGTIVSWLRVVAQSIFNTLR
jgi:hypothetical protein